MTKKIWIICLMAFLSISASAQSLIGKWISDVEKDNDGTMVFIFNFKDKTNLEISVECEVSDEDMVMSFGFTVPGTYKLNGDELNLSLNGKDAKIEIKKLDFKGELAESIKNNSEMKEAMEKLIMAGIEDQKDGLVDKTSMDGDLKISELTDTTLKISDGDDVTVFKRAK